MAETASIMCPEKTVLIPDPEAGCPLADMITVDQLRELKTGHPGVPVVTYVNSTAEIKAESDLCCTSANAVKVVDAVQDGRFAPRPADELRHRGGPLGRLFATRVCRECDVRFSCPSYREYALAGRGRSEEAVREYFSDVGPDMDQESWRTANLSLAPAAGDLTADLLE